MSFAVEIKKLDVSFPTQRSKKERFKALDGLDLTVRSGSVFGFLGPNGAGKTTTIQILLGFIKADRGEVRMFGTDVNESIARQKVGYMPEHPQLYPFLTGRELLHMAGKLFGIEKQDRQVRIDELLETVKLSDAGDRRIGTYSRGMMQRIGLAQALINDPDLVILDEPTSGMDPLGRMEIRQLIGQLRDRGKTVFFSSHELSEVELVCDCVAILVKGKLVIEGKPADLEKEGESLEQCFLRVAGVQDEKEVEL